jgi:hypothetical protein
MDEVFISYRRDDGGYVAAALADSLQQRFGPGSVFLDSGSLLPGVPFPAEIDAAVRRCLVLIALIGPRWLTATTPGGSRRIDDPQDWVRRELRAALTLGVPMLPVLLEGAVLPRATELPPDVRGFVDQGMTRVATGKLSADLVALGDHVRRLAPRITDRTGDTSDAASVQNNHVHGGGDLYASQGGGGMTINVSRPGKERW